MSITRGMKQWTLDSQKKTTGLPTYYKKKVGRRPGRVSPGGIRR